MQRSIAQLSDDEVLQLSQTELAKDQQAELSDLLARNSETALSPFEQRRLYELMQLYRDGLRRKAEALKVAVQRNLIPPLEP